MATLQDNIKLLNSKKEMFAIVLIDFDNQHAQRYEKFQEILSAQACSDRVFLLGIDYKECEDLKKALVVSNFEKIGEKLLEDCPHKQSKHWRGKHLECNSHEIERIKNANVFEWLFE